MSEPGEKRDADGRQSMVRRRPELPASCFMPKRARETWPKVAYALKLALRSEAECTVFTNIYKRTQSGQRLRRGLARILNDDPTTMAFFDGHDPTPHAFQPRPINLLAA